MRCNDFKHLWSAWTDAALSEEMSADAARHLESCHSCRIWDMRMRALEDVLMETGEEDVSPPPFMAARIKALISEERSGIFRRLAEFFAPARLAAITAVVLAFAAGMVSRDFIRETREPGREVASRITIEYEAPNAEKVGLVGDFNNWGKKPIPIKTKASGGTWTFELELAPGRYQYAFEVNGKKWLPDPRAKGIIPDGFGGINSVLYISANTTTQTM